MAILSREPILKLLESGDLEIDPYVNTLIGPASIDLRLGNDFRVFKNVLKAYDVTDGDGLDEITESV